MLSLRAGRRGSARITSTLMCVLTNSMRGSWRWMRNGSEGGTGRGRGSRGLCKITMEIHLVVCYCAEGAVR